VEYNIWKAGHAGISRVGAGMNTYSTRGFQGTKNYDLTTCNAANLDRTRERLDLEEEIHVKRQTLFIPLFSHSLINPNLTPQKRLDLVPPNTLLLINRHTRHTPQSQSINCFCEYLPTPFIPQLLNRIHVRLLGVSHAFYPRAAKRKERKLPEDGWIEQ